MGNNWPRIIRDPIHNIIPFDDNRCDRLLLELVNTPEMQRLRRIKQLGFSHLVFPGADHSRFAHSLGVMHLARRMLDRIAAQVPGGVSSEHRILVLVAALLHDVGHGPFSHAFEKITRENHEKRTVEIVQSPDSEVNKVLKRFAADLPDRLATFFGRNGEASSPDGVPAHLTLLVSSQLDADRFDYLLRDDHAAGAAYGRFDLEWLLQHLALDTSRNRFHLRAKALQAAETYVFARYHMYRGVYYHKTTRAAEVMLRLLLDRYSRLLRAASGEAERVALAPDGPAALRRAFFGNLGLAEYLRLDDHAMTEFTKSCARSSDHVLRELAEGLLNRRLFKALDVTNALSPAVAEFVARAREIVAEEGREVESAFAHDTPSDTAYKLYNPDLEKPATQIFVEDSSGRARELSECSETVQRLTRKYTLVRYYFPASARARILAEAAPLLANA